MLSDIFRQTVKPLLPEHVRDLARIQEAIEWNQEQHHLHIQSVNTLERNQNALGRARRRFCDTDGNRDAIHSLLCSALSLQHEPEIQRATLLIDMHEAVIQVLTVDLERFLECHYNTKPDQGWHLDLRQGVLYKKPVLKKSKHDEETIGECAAATLPEQGALGVEAP